MLYRESQPHPDAIVNSFPFTVDSLPANNAATAQLFRQFVRDNHVDVVFWRQWGYHGADALAYLTTAFGPGRSYAQGTVRVWHFPRR